MCYLNVYKYNTHMLNYYYLNIYLKNTLCKDMMYFIIISFASPAAAVSICIIFHFCAPYSRFYRVFTYY